MANSYDIQIGGDIAQLRNAAASATQAINGLLAAVKLQTEAVNSALNNALNSASRAASDVTRSIVDTGSRGSGAVRGLSDGATGAAGAFEHLNFATAGARRELIVLTHEALTGNWSRFGASLLVLGERIDAMTLLLSPLGLAIAGVTAGLGAMALAAIKGSEEQKTLQNTLSLTGHYAGLTEDSFNALAKTIASSAHTGIRDATNALMSMTQTGQYSRQVMQQMGIVAIDFGKKTGAGTEEALKQLMAMEGGVAKMAYNLTSHYHFLTLEQYKYIEKLEEQGHKERAEMELLKLFGQRVGVDLPQNLGYLAQAWQWVSQEASAAWNAMMNWGKEDTVSEKITNLRQKIAELQANLQKPGAYKLPGFQVSLDQLKGFEAQLEELLKTQKKQQAEAKKGEKVGQPEQQKIENYVNNKSSHKAESSKMAAYEEELAQAKIVYQKEHDLREMSYNDEIQFWEKKKATISAKSKDYLAIQHKISELQLDDMKMVRRIEDEAEKKQRKEQLELDQLQKNRTRQSLLNEIDMKEEFSKRQLELGEITQEQQLVDQAAFEQKRYEIMREAIEKQKALLNTEGGENRNVKSAQLDNQMDQLTQNYQLKAMILRNKIYDAMKSTQAGNDVKNTMFGWLDDGIKAAEKHSLTLKGALTRIWKDTANLFLKYMVTDPLKNWITGEMRKLGFLQTSEAAKTAVVSTGEATRTSLQVASSATVTTAKAGEATTSIIGDAWAAAAGAAKAMASIPFIGPVLAAAAFAGTAALVLGGLSHITHSAAGGFDIPAGLSPVTQLHPQEMVLPSSIGDNVRALPDFVSLSQQMAASFNNNNQSGTSGEMHIHIHAMDSRDVQKALLKGGALHKAFTSLNRSFEVKKS